MSSELFHSNKKELQLPWLSFPIISPRWFSPTSKKVVWPTPLQHWDAAVENGQDDKAGAFSLPMPPVHGEPAWGRAGHRSCGRIRGPQHGTGSSSVVTAPNLRKVSTKSWLRAEICITRAVLIVENPTLTYFLFCLFSKPSSAVAVCSPCVTYKATDEHMKVKYKLLNTTRLKVGQNDR